MICVTIKGAEIIPCPYFVIQPEEQKNEVSGERQGMDMPAAITHYLLAFKALGLYQNKTGDLSVEKDAFLWGAQGPDFFFYHFRKLSRQKKSYKIYGSKLHRQQPSRTFSALRRYYDLNVSDKLVRSYLLGFLCHYSLDRTAHPYVYSCVESLRKIVPGKPDFFLHGQIESALDVIVLREETGCLPTDFDLKKTVPGNRSVMEGIARLYSSVLDMLFQTGECYSPVLQAEKDCRLITRLSNDRTTLKKYLLERVEKFTGKYQASAFLRSLCEDDLFDYSNLKGRIWYPPGNPVGRNDSFFQLFQSSVEESAGFMERFFSCDDYKAMTREIPFG